MAAQWSVAQDTFVAELKDGSALRVERGSTWPSGHEVVRLDAGRGHLFKPLEEVPEEPAPAPEGPVRERLPGAAKAAVRAAARKVQ